MKKKKVALLLLAFVLLFTAALSGCGKNKNNESNVAEKQR
ncbi:hypothetical protein SAMN02745207_02956 [Clostridium grantii DSM 8605]|uniref:Uncharacterized protein n=1 Tax=Clostridium grantii DSM 8605 TaxID=1121316 RepID=A0A1M5WK84_9CLOT|nr:hypothetical protein SAMN02745207_02956 [Clostridium grantii DSM 8605]